MKKRRFRVGIFDSGIGGLTVLNECVRRVPYAKYFYFGDNHRAPYGSRSEEEIALFAREALLRFQRLKVDVAVIACNTATAVAAEELRKVFPFPVLGMEPAIKPAANVCKKVLLLATERTTESAKFKMLLGRFPDCAVQVAPCKYLAGAIEKYLTEGELFLLSAHLPQGKFDGVVLGCTHYSFFASQISAHYSAPVFDGNEGVAKRLERVLEKIALGRGDHISPTENSNNCFNFCTKKRIIFVGKSKKINKSLYFRTYVSKKDKSK